MADDIARSCADCPLGLCAGHHPEKSHPPFCVSDGLTEDQRDKSLARYTEDPEDQKVLQAAASVEADGYRKWPRVEETIEFARRLGAKKIGIATCVALLKETRVLTKILRSHGFEVYGVACKAGEISKETLGIPPEFYGPGTVSCNPILQAQLLNEAGTDLNIVMGLCVGHDSLFYKYSQAVTTTLVVKDRVLMHNPVMALYTADNYHSYLIKKE